MDDAIRKFLTSIPDDIEPPICGLDVDGDVYFEWGGEDPHRVMSVRILGPDAVAAAYAGRCGNTKTHGSFRLPNDFPPIVWDVVRMVQ